MNVFSRKHNEVYDVINKYREPKKKFDYTCEKVGI